LEYTIWNTPFGIPLGALAADPWEPWQPSAWFSWKHDGFIYSALLPFLHHLRPLALRPAAAAAAPPAAAAAAATWRWRCCCRRTAVTNTESSRAERARGKRRALSPGEPGPRPRARESPEEPGRARESPGEPGRARESSGELGGARRYKYVYKNSIKSYL
jgi:hypothetical protein